MCFFSARPSGISRTFFFFSSSFFLVLISPYAVGIPTKIFAFFPSNLCVARTQSTICCVMPLYRLYRRMRAVSVLLVLALAAVVSVAAIRPIDRHRNALLERASSHRVDSEFRSAAAASAGVGYSPKELAQGVEIPPGHATPYFYPNEQPGGAAGPGKIPLAGCESLADAYAGWILASSVTKTVKGKPEEKESDNPMVGVAVTTPDSSNHVNVVVAVSGKTHPHYPAARYVACPFASFLPASLLGQTNCEVQC